MSSFGKRRSSLGHQGADALGAISQAVTARMRARQEAVRRWVRRAQLDEGIDPGGSGEELADIESLKTENQRPRDAVQALQRMSPAIADVDEHQGARNGPPSQPTTLRKESFLDSQTQRPRQDRQA